MRRRGGDRSLEPAITALITRFHFPWLNRCNITRWGGQQPCPGLDIYLYTTYLYTIHSAVSVYSTGVTLQDGVTSSRVRVHHNYNLCHGQADMEITGQQIWFNFSFIALSQFGWLQPPRGRSYSSWDGMKYRTSMFYSLGGVGLVLQFLTFITNIKILSMNV